jgi:hypothetical protein
MGIRCTDCVTPQKLVLTSPTSGGRSVGIVCLWTKATGCVFSLMDLVDSKTQVMIWPMINGLFLNYKSYKQLTDGITERRIRKPQITSLRIGDFWAKNQTCTFLNIKHDSNHLTTTTNS